MLESGTMPSLEDQLKRTIKSTSIILAVLVVALIFDFHDSSLKGLLIGTLVSLQNAIFLSRRISKIGTIKHIGKAISYMRRGFYMRLVLMAATLWLSSRIPGVNVKTAAVGLFVAPTLSISGFFVNLVKENYLRGQRISSLSTRTSNNKLQNEGGENK